MTTQEFIQQLEENYKQGIEIIKSKNHDYASDIDPWKNFRFAELVGITPEKAILVRISDKLARISNLQERGVAKVQDEKIDDTIIDAFNYLNILLVLLQHRRKDE